MNINSPLMYMNILRRTLLYIQTTNLSSDTVHWQPFSTVLSASNEPEPIVQVDDDTAHMFEESGYQKIFCGNQSGSQQTKAIKMLQNAGIVDRTAAQSEFQKKYQRHMRYVTSPRHRYSAYWHKCINTLDQVLIDVGGTLCILRRGPNVVRIFFLNNISSHYAACRSGSRTYEL